MKRNEKQSRISGGKIADPDAYMAVRCGSGYTCRAEALPPPEAENFRMEDLSEDGKSCTLAALTRVLAYYRDHGAAFPEDGALYSAVREAAVKHGYTVRRGTNPFRIAAVAREVLRHFGCPGKVKSRYLWSFSTMRRAIGNGHPLLFNIAFGYYRDHTVTVIGVREYRRAWKKRRLIEVYDGWTKEKRYIDYDRITIGSLTEVIPVK